MNVSPPGHAPLWAYGVLVGISTGYPPVAGRFHTCYSPVRRSPAGKASFAPAAPRLACVRPVASVHPEPGSNSPLLLSFSCFFLSIIRPRKSSPPKLRYLPRLSDAQIYRFYTCAKNHCDVDSVTFSCVTAAPVRTPHLPCLSLFLVYRNHFNELNSLANPGTRMPRFSRLRLQRYYKKPIPTKYFSNFFSRIFQKNPQNITYQPFTPQFFYALQHIFPTRLSEIMQKPIFFSLTPQFLFTHYK